MSESGVVHVTVAPSSVVNNAGGMSRPVCITPLPANMQPLLSALQTVRSKEKQTVRHANSVKSNPVNLNVKIINPDKKRLCETYVLHNVPVSEITTPLKLKEVILAQFGGELVSSDLNFPVGYMRSGTKVWIRSTSDIQDVWKFVKTNENTTLWCHGISAIRTEGESDSDSPIEKPTRKKRKKCKVSYLKEKNDRVDGLVSDLRQKHGDSYNTVQYRMWAEMLDVGSYK